MSTEPTIDRASTENALTTADVETVLRERGWIGAEATAATDAALQAWCERAAFLLGAHATDRNSLFNLLVLVFEYDPATLVRQPENQSVLVREGAREVIRELANAVLAGAEIDSDRLKELIEALKAKLHARGRELFYPLRLALAGRAGDGELDRVILLLDPATKVGFAKPVKGTRERIIEFCAAFD